MSVPAAFFERVAAAPARAAIMLDFDGTLVGHADEPERLGLPGHVRERLRGLVQSLGLVAIISTRPASFLAPRIALDEVDIFGLYGIERRPPVSDRIIVADQAASWLPEVERAHRWLLKEAGEEPVWVEHKGRSTALHWAGANERRVCDCRQLIERVQRATRLKLEAGKNMAELRPPIERDKGWCVRRLAREYGISMPIFCGDDVSDLPALRAAEELGGLAVAVHHGAGTPHELGTVASHHVTGVDGVYDFLSTLQEHLPGPQPTGG